MKIIAFIPARGGSKSIPLKNIKDFCGKPLIYWCLKNLSNVLKIDHIFVASDNEIINQIVLNFHFDKVNIYHRDEENSQDHSSTESVMLEFLEKNNFDDDDIFILSQITSPLTQSVDYENALNLFFSKNVNSLLSCVQNKNFIWNSYGVSLNYDYKNRPRRQDFDGYLVENGAFYINTVGDIKKYKNRLCGKIIIYEMPHYTKFEIDEPDDWIICEALMKKYILKNEIF